MFLQGQNQFKSWGHKMWLQVGGGSRKLPYAFSEQGIYMLMAVLKGDLATKQSKALIRAFKQMKEN